MDSKNEKSKVPTIVKIFWNIVSVPLTLIGLSSLSDGLIAWKGFILDIIRIYQDILYPIYGLLLSWIPFYVPLWVNDYLTVGLLMGTSYVQAILKTEINDIKFDTFKDKILLWMPIVFLMAFIWPLFIYPLLLPLIRSDKMQAFRSKSSLTLAWLAIILISFILLVALNQAL